MTVTGKGWQGKVRRTDPSPFSSTGHKGRDIRGSDFFHPPFSSLKLKP